MCHFGPRMYFDVTFSLKDEEVKEVFFLLHGGLVPSGVQPVRYFIFLSAVCVCICDQFLVVVETKSSVKTVVRAYLMGGIIIVFMCLCVPVSHSEIKPQYPE